MPKRKTPKNNPAHERFTDDIVTAAPGETIKTGAEIDRRRPEYQWGVEAKRAGKPRTARKSMEWLAGYDETPPSKI